MHNVEFNSLPKKPKPRIAPKPKLFDLGVIPNKVPVDKTNPEIVTSPLDGDVPMKSHSYNAPSVVIMVMLLSMVFGYEFIYQDGVEYNGCNH